MQFIFYQNILSIHQSAFLRNLAENHSVILVVPEELDNERAKHGWSIPDFGKTNIIVNPSDAQLNQLLNQKDVIHVFSGIDSFELPTKAFKIAVKNNLKVGVYLEPFNWTGWKGKLRFLKYLLLRLKYNRKMNFILAVGSRGRWCYEKTGFSKNKIFDWAYFTETQESNQIENSSDVPVILFIGSIDARKNILNLVEVCLAIKEKTFVFNIIGTGPLENELKEKIKKSDMIHYLGSVPNTQITQYLERSDVLVLPSIFDGWGAVVNEALMCGVPVIASNNCGSSVLLDNKERGYVFSVEKNNLQKVLADFLKKLPYSIEERQKIKDWALKSISGEVAADYFVQIVDYVFSQQSEQPVAPWLRN